MWISFILRTHKHIHTFISPMKQGRSHAEKYTSPSLFPLSHPHGIRFPSHMHILSPSTETEVSYGRVIGHWEARWEKRKADETSLQPSLCTGKVADSSIWGPSCCLLCQHLCESGSAPEHFFPPHKKSLSTSVWHVLSVSSDFFFVFSSIFY